MSEWVAGWVAFGPSMGRGALRNALLLLHRSVLASTVGSPTFDSRLACGLAGRATPGCSSVMRERRSALSAFLVNVERFKDFEQSFLFSETEAVIDADLRAGMGDAHTAAARQLCHRAGGLSRSL